MQSQIIIVLILMMSGTLCQLFVTNEDLMARQSWERDLRQGMEIPAVRALASSQTHLYALSDQEGLVVFRAYADSLQWLYSSEGMERRGNRLEADVRFAYLYGETERLTVVEPTSLLGVYSSTTLPARPRSVERLDNHLYIAMGRAGLGRLSLESPDALDTAPEQLLEDRLDGKEVLDLVSDRVSQLYLLADQTDLLLLRQSEAGQDPEFNRWVELDRPASRLFLTDDELIGADRNGDLFLIDSGGQTRLVAEVNEQADDVRVRNNIIVIRTESGALWIGEFGRQPEPFVTDSDGEHFFALINNTIWISEYNRIAPLIRVADTGSSPRAGADQAPELKPIEDFAIPYPRPVILPIELLSNHDPSEIELSYRSEIRNARIRGQSFYWQPTSGQTGRHRFTMVASTSTGLSHSVDFAIDVRPFNTPPRFSPIPPQTINAEEPFILEVNAFDPDGKDPDLIRYIGVDLPSGASLQERSGEFRWTPALRQVGEHEFQVIATDQFGAAASSKVRIRVIETDPDAEADIDLESANFD